MSIPASLLNQDVIIYSRTSFDAYGREVALSGITYKARFQRISRSRLLPNSQVVVIDAIAYLNGAPGVEINDRVSYGGNNYKIFGKSIAVDGQGNSHHTKIELVKISS